MKKLAIVEGGEDGGVSVVVNAGKIECIALDRIIDQRFENCNFVEEIDASGMCVLPGKLNIYVIMWKYFGGFFRYLLNEENPPE